MVGALVQLVLVFLDPVLGPAWVLLLGVVVLGLGILQGLGVLELRYLLALGDFLVLGYFAGAGPGVSSSLLDSYSEESSSWSWSGVCS